MQTGMLNRWGLVLALLWSGGVAAEAVMPVTVGGVELKLGLADDFVRTSEAAPEMFKTQLAALPPSHRLVETFQSEGDIKRQLLGLQPEGAMLQVQVTRDLEGVTVSAADWEQARPQIAASLGGIDMNAVTASVADGANSRMSEAAGMKVGVRFGELGKPQLYGDDPQSLRFVMLMPITAEAAGQVQQFTLECAGAIARLNGKLVYLYAFRHHQDGGDASAVQAALDAFVARALALNAS